MLRQLVDLVFKHSNLPLLGKRYTLKLGMTDDDGIICPHRNAGAELLAVRRLKIFLGCDKDICTGIQLQEVSPPLFRQMIRNDKQRLLA